MLWITRLWVNMVYMWITRFKKFYEFQEALFILIFQHFY